MAQERPDEDNVDPFSHIPPLRIGYRNAAGIRLMTGGVANWVSPASLFALQRALGKLKLYSPRLEGCVVGKTLITRKDWYGTLSSGGGCLDGGKKHGKQNSAGLLLVLDTRWCWRQ